MVCHQISNYPRKISEPDLDRQTREHLIYYAWSWHDLSKFICVFEGATTGTGRIGMIIKMLISVRKIMVTLKISPFWSCGFYLSAKVWHPGDYRRWAFVVHVNSDAGCKGAISEKYLREYFEQ